MGEVNGDARYGSPHPNTPNKLTYLEEQQILDMLNSPEYRDKSPLQIVPGLADKGIYIASESTMYRILKKYKMQAHRSRSKAPISRKRRSFCATAPDMVWTWDITYMKSDVFGQYYYLYMFIDIFSRKIVGCEVYENESDKLSAVLLQRIYNSEKVFGKPLVLHSDNGGPMRGQTIMGMLQTLGIIPSRSRPYVSNDNPYSESLFRTLKYCPEFPRSGIFKNITAARQWVAEFVQWYNCEHYHSALKFVTPEEMHTGQAGQVLENRIVVYKEARTKNPQRWRRCLRDWSIPESVWLNPPKCKLSESHNKSKMNLLQNRNSFTGSACENIKNY